MEAEKTVRTIGAFGNDFTMLVFGEAVDHHAVEAGYRANNVGADPGEFAQRVRLHELGDDRLAQAVLIPKALRRVIRTNEFDDDFSRVYVSIDFRRFTFVIPGLQRAREPGSKVIGLSRCEVIGGYRVERFRADCRSQAITDQGTCRLAKESLDVVACILYNKRLGIRRQ